MKHFSVTVPLKAKSSLSPEKRATCWNPERTKLRKPLVYNHQTVDAYKTLIESHGQFLSSSVYKNCYNYIT